jgi:hypothetical protein
MLHQAQHFWPIHNMFPDMNQPLARLVLRSAVRLGPTLVVCGCGAPSVIVAGAYFPAWLVCAILAVVVASVARAVMVATRLSHLIPFQLAVCTSIGVIVALIVWFTWGVS